MGGTPCRGTVFPVPGIQPILEGSIAPELRSLPFRNPDNFLAGQLHQHLHAWNSILEDSPTHRQISDWITNRVDVERFVVPFKGKFKGAFYDNDFSPPPPPPPRVFPNSSCCKKHSAFISKALLPKLRSVRLWFGAAMSLALSQTSLHEIMDNRGWKTPLDRAALYQIKRSSESCWSSSKISFSR